MRVFFCTNIKVYRDFETLTLSKRVWLTLLPFEFSRLFYFFSGLNPSGKATSQDLLAFKQDVLLTSVLLQFGDYAQYKT